MRLPFPLIAGAVGVCSYAKCPRQQLCVDYRPVCQLVSLFASFPFFFFCLFPPCPSLLSLFLLSCGRGRSRYDWTAANHTFWPASSSRSTQRRAKDRAHCPRSILHSFRKKRNIHRPSCPTSGMAGQDPPRHAFASVSSFSCVTILPACSHTLP